MIMNSYCHILSVCVIFSIVGSGVCGIVPLNINEDLEHHYPDLFKHFGWNVAQFLKNFQEILEVNNANGRFNDITKRVCEDLYTETECVSNIKSKIIESVAAQDETSTAVPGDTAISTAASASTFKITRTTRRTTTTTRIPTSTTRTTTTTRPSTTTWTSTTTRYPSLSTRSTSTTTNSTETTESSTPIYIISTTRHPNCATQGHVGWVTIAVIASVQLFYRQ